MADEMVTFDEILNDPMYKSEFDRRVTKALAAIQAKLDTEVEKNKKFEMEGNGETVESLKKQVEAIQSKYKEDTETLKKQLTERDYDDAVKRAVTEKGIKFSSKAAEKSFLADLKANRLELKDGALVGFEDYHKAQMEADPTAFQSNRPAPTFVHPIGPGGPLLDKSKSKGELFAKQFNAQYVKDEKGVN